MKFAIIILLFAQMFTNSNNFIVTYQGETIETVHRSEFATVLGNTHLDIVKLKQYAEKIAEHVKKSPVNAVINDNGVIVSEEVGHKLDHQKFFEEFYRYFFDSGTTKVEVPLITIYPKVDSELLASIRVKRIGEYITYFNSRKKARVKNITLASDAINNHVVFPGEVFSFNEVVGKRTLERGYLPAPIFIKGKISRDFGGGICQVSSTLFNAVDRAGVEILQRYSHSRRVPYVPPGRDATVSWYGPDFVFKNIHNQPILIRSKVFGGALIITIESSDVINYKNKSVSY